MDNEIKDKKVIKIIILITSILLLLGVILSTIFALFNINNTKILKGVSIEGIDVSGLSKEDAKAFLEAIFEERLQKEIVLKMNEYETTMSTEQIEFEFDIDKAVEEAYKIGRVGNIISNNYQILKTKIWKENVKAEISYNNEVFEELLNTFSTNIPNHVEESSYYIDGENLVITKGKEGLRIRKEELKQIILEDLQQQERKESINIIVETAKPSQIDIEKIYQEVYKEPKNAYYTKDPFTIYPHIVGVEFKEPVEEVKAMLQEDKDEYIVPLKLTVPEITTNKIGSEAFPDMLSTFSTKYDASNTNRSTNLRLAAEKINGTVILPGETFSYNKIVGERTIAARL